MTSTTFTISASSAVSSGPIENADTKSSSAPTWVFYIIPLYVLVFILLYFLGAFSCMAYERGRERRKRVLEARMRQTEWELYP